MRRSWSAGCQGHPIALLDKYWSRIFQPNRQPLTSSSSFLIAIHAPSKTEWLSDSLTSLCQTPVLLLAGHNAEVLFGFSSGWPHLRNTWVQKLESPGQPSGLCKDEKWAFGPIWPMQLLLPLPPMVYTVRRGCVCVCPKGSEGVVPECWDHPGRPVSVWQSRPAVCPDAHTLHSPGRPC